MKPVTMNSNHRKTRLAILTNRVSSYRRPIFGELHADQDICLRILLSDSRTVRDDVPDDNLPLHYSASAGFCWTTKHHKGTIPQSERIPVPYMLLVDLMRFRPDIIISGDMGLRSLVAWIFSWLRGVPLIIWSEETVDTAKSISEFQRKLRRFLLKRADAFLALGIPAQEYLLGMEVVKKKIYLGAQAINNEFWKKASASVDRIQLRRELNISGKCFLTVGQLIERKGIDLLISAWAGMQDRFKYDNTLIIVGSGSELEKLKQLASNYDLTHLKFFQHQSPEQLAHLFAAADVMVFPTLADVWGMVVNEAMACGLPVLASCYSGAAHGLVAGSGAGEVFDPLDVPGFSDLLARWISILPAVPRHLPQKVVSNIKIETTITTIKKICNDFK
jgi:glycosyltransferase involved in cell wall biosynthesis